MNRHTAREKALQALFQVDVSEIDPVEAMNHVLLEEEKLDSFMETLVLGVVEKIEGIDSLLKDCLENWTIDRLANVDRNILRLAIYEMTELEDVPVNVSFNEAIELAKVFGDDDSSKFVNAVLSKVKAKLNL